MRRNKINLIVDVVTLVAFLGIVLTGILMRYVLPPGTRGGGCGLEFAGLARHQWGEVHFWISVGMGACIVLHLAFHWNWVCVTISRLFTSKSPSTAQRNMYGVVALLLVSGLLVGFVLFGQSQVDLSQGGEGEEQGRQFRGGSGSQAEEELPGTPKDGVFEEEKGEEGDGKQRRRRGRQDRPEE